MKRTLTGIVAASMVLGTLAPAAFASTTNTLTSGGGKTISLDGTTLYSGVQVGNALDAGTTTTYFPIWYLQQALTKGGYTNTYNPSTATWDITMPGVNASTLTVDGGVGTGNAAISINGVVVKKFNAQWAPDLAGGKNASVTTYFPVYYLGNVLAAAGFTNAWDGNSFGFKSYNVAPAVASVSALNLKQVLVTFNKPVDATTAQDITNYSVTNGAGNLATTAGDAVLQADGKSVIINLDTKFNNNTTAEVKVSGVKDLNGAVISAYDNANVAVTDVTAPTVTGVTVTGPRTLQVNFSEPVKSVGANFAGDIQIDGGNYVVSQATANAAATALTVIVGAPLTNGSHTITLNSSSSDLTDYAGYVLATVTKSFAVNPVTTAPTVTVQSASQTRVVLKFSAPVSNAGILAAKIYGVYNNSTYGDLATPTPDANGTSYSDGVNTFSDTWDLSFAKPLPAGNDALFINSDTTTPTPIADAYSNAFASAATLSLNIVNDTTAPVVKSATIAPNAGKTAHTLSIVFNKDVVDQTSGAAPTAANVVVKDSSGNVVNFVKDGYDTSTYTLTLDSENAVLAPALLPGDTYTVTVSNLQDTTPNLNKMTTYTTNIVVPNIIAPTATSTYMDGGTKIAVAYSTAMNTSQTGNAANYLVKDNGTTAVSVSSVQVIDSKNVVLTLASALTATKTPSVAIQNVSDTNSNPIASFGSYSVPTPTADTGATVVGVKAIDASDVQVTFDRVLTGMSASGYSFDDIQAAPAASTVQPGYLASVTTNSSNETVATFHLATALGANAQDAAAKQLSLVVASGASGVDSLGVHPLATPGATAVNAYTVTDAIAPTVKAVKWTSATTITVQFTENVAGVGAGAADGFTTSSGAVTATLTAPDTITLTAASGVTFTQGTTSVSYNSVAGITDTAANALASFTGQVAN